MVMWPMVSLQFVGFYLKESFAWLRCDSISSRSLVVVVQLRVDFAQFDKIFLLYSVLFFLSDRLL